MRYFQRKVDRYDGQVVYIDGEPCYELGNYLGGGAAGVVYEAVDLTADPTTRNVAVKILNPVPFKLMPGGSLQRCLVVVKGSSGAGDTRGLPMREDRVWWLVHPNSKQVIGAYEDPKHGTLREIPLPKCIEIWGWDGLGGGNYDDTSGSDELLDKICSLGQEVTVDGITVTIPRVPPKYIKWLKSRRCLYREIANMNKLGSHPNVIRLNEVLELIQDSKSTLFLVLELVTGGELFDRIKIGTGTTEDVARRYFRQLLSGVGCCHARGICHRDLKPENLLLSDGSESAVLKIADFGLSAAFAIAAGGGELGGNDGKALAAGSSHGHHSHTGHGMRRLRSVVGTPYYQAPEVTIESGQGYDGTKADAWSAGVILYAMVIGSLPFGKELSQCPRYQRFRRALLSSPTSTCMSDKPDGDLSEYPSCPWLFPQSTSASFRLLVVGLLHPDPHQRMSIEAALRHPWVTVGGAMDEQTTVYSLIKSMRNLDVQRRTPSPPSQEKVSAVGGSGGEGCAHTHRTWN